jgi:small-conductance mechanosensitive channel
MKKLLFLALSMLIALPTMANDDVKNWNFTNNEDGECVIDVVIPTEKDQATAIKAVKATINKITLSGRNLLGSTDSTLVYHLTKNTKMRYNPFAGNFTEDMAFNLLVTYSENSIKLHITEPTVVCGYSGYGSKVTSKSFASRIDEFNTYQEKLNDSSVKSKEKKEIKSEIKNINGELNMCQEEFNKMLETIKKGL